MNRSGGLTTKRKNPSVRYIFSVKPSFSDFLFKPSLAYCLRCKTGNLLLKMFYSLNSDFCSVILKKNNDSLSLSEKFCKFALTFSL